MSRHDLRLTLRQMRDHAHEAVRITEARRREDLDSDRMFELALTRLLEIVGEAARRVPAENRRTLPGIPWSEVAGMRDRIIHGYDNVDLDVVWRTVREDLPRLVAELDRALADR